MIMCAVRADGVQAVDVAMAGRYIAASECDDAFAKQVWLGSRCWLTNITESTPRKVTDQEQWQKDGKVVVGEQQVSHET